MPNVPDNIETKISIDSRGLINLLLISIALEELSIAQIVSAESEMLHLYLKKIQCEPLNKDEMIRMNRSVTETLKIVLEKEKTLNDKLNKILTFYEDLKCHRYC